MATILVFALGITQILAFFDTNILVSPKGNCGVGGLSQREDPTQMVFASQWNIGLRPIANTICIYTVIL